MILNSLETSIIDTIYKRLGKALPDKDTPLYKKDCVLNRQQSCCGCDTHFDEPLKLDLVTSTKYLSAGLNIYDSNNTNTEYGCLIIIENNMLDCIEIYAYEDNLPSDLSSLYVDTESFFVDTPENYLPSKQLASFIKDSVSSQTVTNTLVKVQKYSFFVHKRNSNPLLHRPVPFKKEIALVIMSYSTLSYQSTLPEVSIKIGDNNIEYIACNIKDKESYLPGEYLIGEKYRQIESNGIIFHIVNSSKLVSGNKIIIEKPQITAY